MAPFLGEPGYLRARPRPVGGDWVTVKKVRPNPDLLKSDDRAGAARVLFKAGFSFGQVAALLSVKEEFVHEAIRRAL